jgi:transcription elongation GreA/GreB family factor
VGRALVGRLPGERVDVETPRGVVELELLEVRPAYARLQQDAA